MTNSWGDMKNSKLILVQGSNFVENHPGCVQWVNEAIENNGCKVVVVDPRKTRTAVWAEQRGGTSLKIRPGTDLAFTMGVINYAIANGNVDWTYLDLRTDAIFRFDAAASGEPCSLTNSTAGNNAQCDYLRSAASGVYAATPVAASGGTAQSRCEQPDTVFSYLKKRASHYTAGVVADICGCSVTEFNAVAALITDLTNRRPGSIFYAMGGTQHTYASQQLHAYCVLQLVLGNMGRIGGGVNALRGIHNVQGSTDMGMLYADLPGYTGAPGTTATYVGHMDTLYGTDVGSGNQQLGFRNLLNAWFRQSTGSPIAAVSGATGSASGVGGYIRDNATGTTNANYAFIPKGNGYHHVQMFQNMKSTVPATGRVTALFVLGQNPAVTEPNLPQIRAGLYELDTLVVADMYMSETATCSRKGTGKTYLLPSAAHVEEAGSVTSSARMIYWRYMAKTPTGGSRNDLWILLKLARALATSGGFDHIDLAGSYTDRYNQLYGDPYHSAYGAGSVPDFTTTAGTDPNGTPKFVGSVVAENVFKEIAAPLGSSPWGTVWIYADAYDNAVTGTGTGAAIRYGTKLSSGISGGSSTATLSVAHDVTQGSQMIAATGATSITAYLGNFGAPNKTTGGNAEKVTITSVVASGTVTVSAVSGTLGAHAAGEPLTVNGYWSHDAADGILVKSRSFYQPFDNNIMPRFGFSWLVNRRIFYNNNPCPTGKPANRYSPGHVTYCETCVNGPNGGNTCMAPGDTNDIIVAPDKRARILVHHSADTTPIMNTGVYRTYNKFTDTDYPSGGGWTDTSSVGYGANKTRLSKHWEPWESPKASSVRDYGRTGEAPTAGASSIGDRAQYPLVLTTWRLCWHFQGGPMSRNVPWLAELDPDPMIEINSVDAYAYGIADGDDVYVHTSRATNCGPFKARVGSGTQPNQNTKLGVVGIPWHWGRSKKAGTSYGALVEGASANEVTIDALDSTAKMPESKACLCTLTKTLA